MSIFLLTQAPIVWYQKCVLIMSRYTQQLSLWFFPDISELNCQFHYFPNPANLTAELVVGPDGSHCQPMDCSVRGRGLCSPPLLSLLWAGVSWDDTGLGWSLAPPCHPLRCHLSSSGPQLEGALSIFCCGISSFSADSVPCSTAGVQVPGLPGTTEMWGLLSRSHSRTHPCLCDCSLPAAPQWLRATSLVHLGNEGHSTVYAKHPSPGLERGALLLPQELGLSRQEGRLLQMPCKF